MSFMGIEVHERSIYMDGDFMFTVPCKKVDDTRENGESWRAMYARTQVFRDDADREAVRLALVIAGALETDRGQ